MAMAGAGGLDVWALFPIKVRFAVAVLVLACCSLSGLQSLRKKRRLRLSSPGRVAENAKPETVGRE